MSRADEILRQAVELPADQQCWLIRELARSAFRQTMTRSIAETPETPLPLSDADLDGLIHEVRRETLRARGL